MAEHVMENDFLRVTVSDHGAELISVWDKERGQERIWQRTLRSGIVTRRFSFLLWGR